MSAQFHFAAERRAAVHCTELLAREAPRADPLSSFGAFALELAAGFARELQAMMGGNLPDVAHGEIRRTSAADLQEQAPPLAGNLLIPVGASTGPLLASFPITPLVASVEALFGGGGRSDPGETEGQITRLPRSLELLIERLGAGLRKALANCIAPEFRDALGTPRFESDLRKLAPFAARTELAAAELEFNLPAGPAIRLRLVCRLNAVTQVVAMCADLDSTSPLGPTELAAPFSEIALPLHAVLADMTIAASKLSALQAGSVLPLAISRRVPLKLGDRTIAYGAVGEIDDRCALQIESTLIGGDQS